LKIKNLFLSKLVWLMPILTAALTMFLSPRNFQKSSYNFWYVLMLPGSVSLIFTLLSRIDGRMKNKAVISLPLDLGKVWLAKVLVGIKCMSISCFIIFLAALISPIIVKSENVPIGIGLAATIILIATFAWQVPLCMFLGNKIGLYQTIIIIIPVNFVSSILAVKNYWWALPFSYPARLMCPILKILPNGLPAVPGSVTFTEEVLKLWNIPLGLSISVILFFAVTWLTAKWYKLQEVM
jgi:ABC-2 type transport system permease protein